MSKQPSGTPLTPHEDETFVSQVVFLSGHSYRRCRFERCTMMVTNLPFILTQNEVVGCNWHIEYDILAGDPNSRSNLRRLIDAIDGAADEIGLPCVLVARLSEACHQTHQS